MNSLYNIRNRFNKECLLAAAAESESAAAAAAAAAAAVTGTGVYAGPGVWTNIEMKVVRIPTHICSSANCKCQAISLNGCVRSQGDIGTGEV